MNCWLAEVVCSQEAGTQGNGKASNIYVERNCSLFLFTFWLLVAQPKTHGVLPKVGFERSAVWGEIQTVNSFKLSSSTLRSLQKRQFGPGEHLDLSSGGLSVMMQIDP